MQTTPFCVPCKFVHHKPESRLWSSSPPEDVWRRTPCCSGTHSTANKTADHLPSCWYSGSVTKFEKITLKLVFVSISCITNDITCSLIQFWFNKLWVLSSKGINTHLLQIYYYTAPVVQWLMTPPVTRHGVGLNPTQAFSLTGSGYCPSRARGWVCVMCERSVSMTSELFWGGWPISHPKWPYSRAMASHYIT